MQNVNFARENSEFLNPVKHIINVSILANSQNDASPEYAQLNGYGTNDCCPKRLNGRGRSSYP